MFCVILFGLACNSNEAQINQDGNEAFANQNFQDALDAYMRVNEKNPDMPEPYYNTGNTYYRQDRYDEAINQMVKTIEISDDKLLQDTHFNLGNIYFQKQQLQQAIEEYKNVLRLNSTDQDAKYNLELALETLEQQPPTGNEEGEQDNNQSEPQTNNQSQQNQNPPEEQESNQMPPEESNVEQVSPGTLSEQQARRLLEAIAQNTDTLQEHLQQEYVPSDNIPSQDW